MDQVQKIAHNTIIQIIGKGLTVVFALAIFGLITRSLGQEGFGHFTTVYAFLTIFGILVDLGLQMTTTQLISDPAEDEGKILSNALTIRLIASVIFLGFAPVAVIFFPYPTIIKLGVAVAAIGFVFGSLSSTLISFFQKNLIMKKVVIAEVIAKIISLVAIAYVVYAGLGLIGIIAAVILDTFFTFTIMLLFAINKVNIRPAFELKVWKKIIYKTWPIALTISLNLIYFKGDILIMSLISSQAEVGLYGAPYKILEVLINGVYLFLGLILPILATAAAINNFEQIKKIIQKSFDFIIIITIPMIVGGFFLGKDLMVLFAGEDFAISGDILKILLLATGAIFLAGLFGYAVVALNKQKQMIKFYAANAVISIIGYYYLITKYSYWGAAWMTVATEIFILITAFYVMNKTIKLKLNLKIATKALIASLIMALPLYFLASQRFEILLILGIIIYFVILYLLRGIDHKNLAKILSTKKDAGINN